MIVQVRDSSNSIKEINMDKNLLVSLNKFLHIYPSDLNFGVITSDFYLERIKAYGSSFDTIDLSNSNIKSIENIEVIPFGYTGTVRVIDLSNNDIREIELDTILNLFTNSRIILLNLLGNPLSEETRLRLMYIDLYLNQASFANTVNKFNILYKHFTELDPVICLLLKRKDLISRKKFSELSKSSNLPARALKQLEMSIIEKIDRIEINPSDESLYKLFYKNQFVTSLKGISALKNVKYIKLGNQSLFNYDSHLDRFFLPNLQTLDLSMNPYLSSVPNFSECSELKYLYLNNTRFSRLDWIINLAKLVRLNVAYCKNSEEITDSEFMTFIRNSENLKYFNAEGCGLTISFNPTTLLNLAIESINIKKNSTTISFGNSTLEFSSKVRYIDFSNTLLDNDSATTSNIRIKATKAKVVKLNNLTYDKMDHLEFNSMSKLERLELENSQISSINEIVFTDGIPRNLKLLNLKDNQITSFKEDKIFFNHNLVIDLRGNPLDRASQIYLSKLNNMQNAPTVMFDENLIYTARLGAIVR